MFAELQKLCLVCLKHGMQMVKIWKMALKCFLMGKSGLKLLISIEPNTIIIVLDKTLVFLMNHLFWRHNIFNYWNKVIFICYVQAVL